MSDPTAARSRARRALLKACAAILALAALGLALSYAGHPVAERLGRAVLSGFSWGVVMLVAAAWSGRPPRSGWVDARDVMEMLGAALVGCLALIPWMSAPDPNGMPRHQVVVAWFGFVAIYLVGGLVARLIYRRKGRPAS